MPPVVNTPSGRSDSSNPMRSVTQSMSLCSMRHADVPWSHVSTAVFTDVARASAATAGIVMGQFRCAR